MANQENATAGGAFTLLVLLSLLITFVVVILSAYIRLTDTGLGCSPWPECYGYIESPAGATVSEVDTTRERTWAAVIHRPAAALLGMLILAIVFISVRKRRQPGVGVAIPFMLLALTVFLSVLGYGTPSPLHPAITLGNLLGGMTMLALLWWLAERSIWRTNSIERTNGNLKLWAGIGLVVISVQIALGAWTSANFAGPSCLSLPGCDNDTWWSGAAFVQGFDVFRELSVDPQGKVITDDAMAALHMTHRLGGIITLLYVGWLSVKTLALGARFLATGTVMLILLLLQVGLGVGTVLTGLPIAVVTLHNAVAALLLLAIVHLNQLLTARRG